MKKYYIPTSSLNFNNILSTESISPKDFYQARDFGYARWEAIKENDIASVVLLYAAPHAFTRPKGNSEDHPLLIEYESAEEFPIVADGVYYTDKTIYLNPAHTRFIFFSERDKEVTLSMSESSLETKMITLYQKRIVVVDTSIIEKGDYPVINPSKIDVHENNAQIDYDRKLNKMKGLLYGYYIGAYLSLNDEELLRKTNTLREISNIFASIISSPDRKPSATQETRLSALFLSLHKSDLFHKEIKEIIGDEDKTDEVFTRFEKEVIRIFDTCWRVFMVGITSAQSDNCYAITWVEEELNKQNRLTESKRVPLAVEKEEIVTRSLQLDTIGLINVETLVTIYKAWVNEILSTNEYTGKINSQRKDLADRLTLRARDILGDKWEGSPIRTYLNQLRHHLNGEEFTQPWDNGMLSSIASCLEKGDDWGELLRFMQSKGMTDYRLAFSFYGVLNGFANLTRDFTNLLLSLDDRKYVWGLYQEFAKQLLNVEKQEASGPKDSDAPCDIIAKIIKFLRSLKNKRCLKGKPEKINKLIEGVTQAGNELGAHPQNEKLLKLLSTKYQSYGWAKNLTPFKQLKEYLESGSCPNEPKGSSSEKEKPGSRKKKTEQSETPENKLVEQSLPLYGNDNRKEEDNDSTKEKALHFYNDPSTITDLQSIIDKDNLKDVLWFFEDLQKPAGQRTWYQKVDHVEDDKKVIDLFCKDKTQKGKEAKIFGLIGSEKIEEIRTHFYKKYGIKQGNNNH